MCSFIHSTLCCHGKKAYFAIFGRCQNYHTFTQFFFQLIAQVTQSIHIYAINGRCQNFHTFYFHNLIHNISQRILSHLTLQRFIFTLQFFYFFLQMCDLFCDLSRTGLQCFCDCMQIFFHLTIVFDHVVTCQCFDTTNTCRNTCFGYDLEQCNIRCICHMSTTTEFYREIAHGYHTYLIAVFLTE